MAPSSSDQGNISHHHHHGSASCSCSNNCQRFELLPTDQGIMITLHLPSSPPSLDAIYENDDRNNYSSSATAKESPDKKQSHANSHTSKKKNICTCLKLHPQMDANLSQFHPNIYIPAALLDYPEHLTKYGGGGEM